MTPPQHQWSDWIWSDEFHSYYRYRPDDKAPGEYVYDYYHAETEAVPRTNASGAVDALAEGVSRLRYSTDDTTQPEAQGSQYQYSNEPSPKPSSKSSLKPSPKPSPKASSSSKPSRDRDRDRERDRERDKDREKDRDKDKEKAKERDRERGDKKTSSSSSKTKSSDKSDRGDKRSSKGKSPEALTDGKPAQIPEAGAFSNEQYLGQSAVQRYDDSSRYGAGATYTIPTYAAEGVPSQGETQMMRQDEPAPGLPRDYPSPYGYDSVQQTRQIPSSERDFAPYVAAAGGLGAMALQGSGGLGQGTTGMLPDALGLVAQPLSSTPSTPPNPAALSPTVHRGTYPDDSIGGSSIEATSPYHVTIGPSSPTTDMAQRIVAVEEDDHEELDPRYKLEMSYKFGAGMVFKVLWPEPMGSNQAASSSDRQRVPDGYGGDVHVGFRRFIVIANDAGHCTCVPILTYNNQACKKKGVKPEKHGVVYEKGKRPKLLDGEPPLGFKPIGVNIEAEGESLSRESRVNYSKLITVEHNVKVFFIGHVIESDFRTAQAAVDTCWINKNRAIRQPSKGR